jgi:N-acetylneuraminate lyase
MIGFLEKISEILPNFAGIKYTHEDFMDFLSCLNFQGGRYDILWGKDECILSSLVLGCKGAVGSTFNYAAPLYSALIKAFKAGNLTKARELQQQSNNIVTLLGKYGGIATGKAFMKYIGLDCGRFRSPVRNMPDNLYKNFVDDVRNLGIDVLFSKK